MNPWFRVMGAFGLDILIRILFDPGEWTPDLLLIAIVYAAMTRPPGEAYFIAFAMGLLWDALYVEIPATHAFLFVIAAMIAARLRALVWGQYAITRLLLGFGFSAVVRFGEVIFWLSILDYEVPLDMPRRYILGGAAATGLLFLAIPWTVERKPPAAKFQTARAGERLVYD